MRITTDFGQDLDALRDVPAAIVLDDFAWPPLPSRRADFDGVTRGDASQRELGLMLLDLYAIAARSGIGEFEYRFFAAAGACPFDAAWTGVATHVPTGPVMHNSFLYRLPHAFFSDWKRVRDATRSRTARCAARMAMRCGCRSSNQADARFRDWCVKYGAAQLMCVCTLDRRFGLTTFMSIYRQGLNRPFSDDDARRFEEVIPHLAAALTINRAAQLTRERGETVAPAARALRQLRRASPCRPRFRRRAAHRMAGVGRYARAGAARRAFAAPVRASRSSAMRCESTACRLRGCSRSSTAALAARPAERAARGDPLLRRRALAQGSRATDGDFADDRAPLPALRVPQARHARQEPDRRRARRNGSAADDEPVEAGGESR